jgi:hypothetical protein
VVLLSLAPAHERPAKDTSDSVASAVCNVLCVRPDMTLSPPLVSML